MQERGFDTMPGLCLAEPRQPHHADIYPRQRRWPDWIWSRLLRHVTARHRVPCSPGIRRS
jgi:hypothetical protein